ncbi:MAG: hypothetical protein D6723_12990 [Acidobacteria bacterium]|nr:MAG: hypothetical protein D6723_12990 [Acidobacteriota bacterium]
MFAGRHSALARPVGVGKATDSLKRLPRVMSILYIRSTHRRKATAWLGIASLRTCATAEPKRSAAQRSP